MGTQRAEDEADLGLLARQTLSGVEVTELPPEPLALGVDLGRLATTSRPPAAPRADDDTDGRIDLRASSPGVVPAAASNGAGVRPEASPAPTSGPAALAARLRSSRPAPAAVSVLASAPPLAAARPIELRPATQAERELDALIASRAFSASAALQSALQSSLALVRRAPSWVWVLSTGIAIGLTLGVSLGGGDDDAPASAPIASATATPTPSSGVPVLPQVVAGAYRPLASPAANGTTRERRASFDRGPRRAAGAAAQGTEPREAPAAAATPAPAAHEPRSIDALLDQAVGAPTLEANAAPARPKPAASGLPPTPERAEVARLLGSALPRVRFCAGGRSGVAKAEITARSSGRITQVKIVGAPFARTTSARCMETAIRGVTFPPFGQPTFRVTYPYAL